MSVQLDSQSRSRTLGADVAVFLAVAFGLPWLLWLLRLATGIDVVAAGGMVSVGIATFVAVRWVRRPASIALETGLLPVRPWPRTLARGAGALGLVVGLASLAILIGAAAGVTPLDIAGLSAARETYGSTGLGPAALQSVLLFLVLLPLAFCEEWGWRGFLLPRLLRFGTWPAFVASGLVWGLWHLPGYVGPNARGGLVPFLVFTVLFGVVLGWLRLRTRTVWPAVVAHAANNTIVTGFVNVAFLDAAAVRHFDPWSFGLSGWPGWIVMGLLIAYLAATGRLGREVPQAN